MNGTGSGKFLRKVKHNRNAILFITIGLAFPLVQFILFYICVNANSLILAFKEYQGDNSYTFAGLDNFKRVIQTFLSDPMKLTMLKNSLVMCLFSVAMIFVNIIVTYLLWRKAWGSGFFKVILFMPSIISTIVFVVIFRYVITDALPAITHVEKLGELLSPPEGFYTMLVLSAILGFGPAILVFLGTMSTVDTSLVEYGKIDGMNIVQEFWHLILPHLYSTIVAYVIISLATLFSNYGLIFAFFDANADVSMRTLGYDLFVRVYASVNYYEYPVISATGLLYTVITLPIVFGVRRAMEWLGPKEQ